MVVEDGSSDRRRRKQLAAVSSPLHFGRSFTDLEARGGRHRLWRQRQGESGSGQQQELVAMVDVGVGRLAAAARKASEAGATPKTFFDCRRMFDAMHKEIDAVFMATQIVVMRQRR